jgi:hypothetical protein
MRLRSFIFLPLAAAACSAWVALDCEAGVNVELGQNFTAAALYSDSNLVPPDSNGAIGPNHFVLFINGRFSVFDKTSGVKVKTTTDSAFWTNAGVTLASGALVSDPRIIYDSPNSRWFASQIDFIPTSEISNRFLLAVSTTSDPSGPWKATAWMADPGGTFADFPRLGLDSKGVYLSANQFTASGQLAGVLITSIPKNDLLATTPSVANRTCSGVMPVSTRGFSLQPAVNLNSVGSGLEFVIAVENDGTDFATHTVLRSFNIAGADSPSATFSPNTTIDVPDYYIPFNPPQPDTQTTLDAGDVRMGAYVFQVGNVMYATHAIQFDTHRAAIRWYRLRAADHSVLESGTITDPDLDLFYPSIAANTNGFMVIACNGSSLNSFVSAYAFAGRTINGGTVFGGKVLLKAGAANYELPLGGSNRWGDYSTTTPDPANPNHFWTVQEFPSNANVWSTQVTEMIVSESAPLLSISKIGANAFLSWPTNDIGFTLQSSGTPLPSAAWSAVTNAVSVAGSRNSVMVNPRETTRFFRLIR